MRGLSVLDVLIIFVVVAVLFYAGSRDFPRYDSHMLALAATPSPTPTAGPGT
jgi:hypothetical protein